MERDSCICRYEIDSDECDVDMADHRVWILNNNLTYMQSIFI